MIVKAVALAVAGVFLSSASPAPQDQKLFVNFPGIHLVRCKLGSGTAFRIEKNRFLSVAHVTGMEGCGIGGVPLTSDNDGGLDYSSSVADVPGPRLKVSCEGFHAGEWVWAIGYAGGVPVQTAVALYTTYAKDGKGQRILMGRYTVIPGMSGGPVFNAKGQVIGLVNAYVPGGGLSFSRDLRDTPYCK